jgi:putative ABC transport system substrate-binding protein
MRSSNNGQAGLHRWYLEPPGRAARRRGAAGPPGQGRLAAPDPKPFALDPFRQRLKKLRWIEGGNLVIEQRYSHGVAERYAPLATELVRLKVDALVTDGQAATRAAQRTTPTIPILFVSGNPVAQGFVTSLSHPGKNLTGVAILTGDLTPKRIQLLKETATGMARLAILEDFTSTPGDARMPGNWRAIEAASRQLGIRLGPTLEIRKSEELDGAFALAVKGGAGGVLVLPLRSSPHKARGS